MAHECLVGRLSLGFDVPGQVRQLYGTVMWWVISQRIISIAPGQVGAKRAGGDKEATQCELVFQNPLRCVSS